MRVRGALIAALLALVALPAAVHGADGDPEAYWATLDGAQETPPVATTASGAGWVAISGDESMIAYYVEYAGLSGPLAAAHIHLGAVGVAGGVMFPLTASDSPMVGVLTEADFSATGSVTTYAEALAAIRAGETYFNLHTEANPAGEIRGQIATAGEVEEAVLSGDQEVPPVETDGSGYGVVVEWGAGNATLSAVVTYTGLSGPAAAAHVHEGAPGVNGGVILPLTARGDDLFWASGTGNEAVSAAVDAGEAYFNVHTEAHPGGEIRGDIGAAAPAPSPSAAPSEAPTAAPTTTVTPPPTETVDGRGGGDESLLGLLAALAIGGLAALAAARRLALRTRR